MTFRRSARARLIRMQVDSQGQFMLVAPMRTSESEIRRFIERNHSWIEKQRAKREAVSELRPDFNYHTGDLFYYFGEPVTLRVIASSKKRPILKIRENVMFAEIHEGLSDSEGRKVIKSAVERFYRSKAEEVIHDRLEHFNEHYGFQYFKVTLRNQKTRWGSCSHAGNLNFNWRLIMAPIEVIDYVVVHELCHLKEMNHSYRFWSLVEKTLPDYRVTRNWLKKNHYLLRY